MIIRELDANHINQVLNHPEVREWVANDTDGVIDLTPAVSDQRNVLLMGEHGGCFFAQIQAGVYEVHTQVLPSGRGKWTRLLTEACARFMFTQTDAYEIVTRIPQPHVAARTAAQQQGMKLEFTRPGEVVFKNQRCDVDIYSFRLQDWAADARGMYSQGQWLHERMEQEAQRLGITIPTHEPDPNHNQYVGVAIEMAFGGQYLKAVNFYNRWVSLVRSSRSGKLQHISLVCVNPLVIRFDIGLMKFANGDIEVIQEC